MMTPGGFGMSVGTSVAIINYISRIFAPIESLGMEIQTIQSAMAGVRRIEAVTAEGAEKYVNDQLHQLAVIKSELKNPADPVKSLKELLAEVKDLKQQIEEVEAGKATMIKSALMQSVETINGIRFVSHEVDISDQKLIKQMIYQMGQELGDQSFLLLGSKGDGKAQLTLYISEELVKTKKLHAGNIVKDLAKSICGGGGGQPFFATAGGTSSEGLKEALERARTFIL